MQVLNEMTRAQRQELWRKHWGWKTPEEFGLTSSENSEEQLSFPRPSRAERNVPRSSKGHCTAYSFTGSGSGYVIQAESHLELKVQTVLEATPDVADMREQVKFRYGFSDAPEQMHVFDLVVTLDTGQKIACAIKPEFRVHKPKRNHRTFYSEMQEVAGWVHELGFADDVRIFTDRDIDPIDFHNAKLSNAVKRLPDTHDADALSILRSLPVGSGQTVFELTQKLGRSMNGVRAFYRLLFQGHATLLKREKINAESVIVNAHPRAQGQFPEIFPRLGSAALNALNDI